MNVESILTVLTASFASGSIVAYIVKKLLERAIERVVLEGSLVMDCYEFLQKSGQSLF
jgi:hypothetical protein